MQAELAQGEEADEETLLTYATRLQSLSPDLAQNLLAGLANFPETPEALIRMWVELRSRGLKET